MNRSVISAALAAVLSAGLTMPTGVRADVVSYVTGVPDVSDYYEFDESYGGDSLFVEAIVTGLPRFDPALGTLTGVSIDVEFDYSISASVEAVGVIDDALPHTAGFTTSFADFELIYQKGGSGYVLGSQPTIDMLECSGGAFDAACFTDDFDSGTWSAAGIDAASVSGFELSDFVGAGEVSVLELWFVLYELGVNLDNADGLYGTYDISVDPASPPFDSNSVTINYTYAPVPLPPALWMLGGALAVLMTRMRR